MKNTSQIKTLTFIVFSILIGCQSNQTKNNAQTLNENNTVVFKADSSYLMEFVLNKSIPIKKLNDPINYGKNESIYTLLKEKAQYYEIMKIDFKKEYFGRIIGVYFPGVSYDGDLKIIFFATYDMRDRELSSVRFAKYEIVSDINALETGIINGNQIKIKRNFSSIDFDESYVDNYQISDNGQIIKK